MRPPVAPKEFFLGFSPEVWASLRGPFRGFSGGSLASSLVAAFSGHLAHVVWVRAGILAVVSRWFSSALCSIVSMSLLIVALPRGVAGQLRPPLGSPILPSPRSSPASPVLRQLDFGFSGDD